MGKTKKPAPDVVASPATTQPATIDPGYAELAGNRAVIDAIGFGDDTEALENGVLGPFELAGNRAVIDAIGLGADTKVLEPPALRAVLVPGSPSAVAEELPEGDVLGEFELAMRLVFDDVLAKARVEAEQTPERFDRDYPAMLAIAEALDVTEKRLFDHYKLWLMSFDPGRYRKQFPEEHPPKHPSPAEAEQAATRMRADAAQIASLLLAYPLFKRLPGAHLGALSADAPVARGRTVWGAFLALSKDSQLDWIRREVGGVLTSIDQAQAYFDAGKVELWSLPPIVEATLQARDKGPAERSLVAAKVSDVEWDETVRDVALAATSIGLGLAAALTTGPLGIALGAGAVMAGMADTALQTDAYLRDRTLSNTDVDLDEALVDPRQLQGSEFWLAVAWVGAGVDLVGAVKIFRMLGEGVPIAVAFANAGFQDLLDEAVRLSAKRGLLDELVELAGEEVRRIFDRLGPPNRGLVPADGTGGWLDDVAGPTANPSRTNPVTPDQLRPPGVFMAMGDELDALGSKITSEVGSDSPLHRRLEELRHQNAQIEALEEQAKNGDIDAAYEAAEKTDELAREVQRLEDEVMTALPGRMTGSITDIFEQNIPRLLASNVTDKALEWKVRKITNGGPCRPPCPVIGPPANHYYVEIVDDAGNYVNQWTVNFDPVRGMFGLIKKSTGPG